MQKSFLHNSVSEIVRANYRTADVFKSYGINYCCGGAITLAEACRQKDLSAEEVLAQLQKVVQPLNLPPDLQYSFWNLDFLVDYIINVHHAYLKTGLPKMEVALVGFVNGHKKKMPSLENILAAFQTLMALLQQQMEREEATVFPYIKQVDAAFRRRETYGSLFVKTLRKPLQKEDALAINDALSSLRRHSNNYQFGDDACTTHRVVFQQLQELENDLVQHKYLENNVLFPRAEETEQRLLQGTVH